MLIGWSGELLVWSTSRVPWPVGNGRGPGYWFGWENGKNLSNNFRVQEFRSSIQMDSRRAKGWSEFIKTRENINFRLVTKTLLTMPWQWWRNRAVWSLPGPCTAIWALGKKVFESNFLIDFWINFYLYFFQPDHVQSLHLKRIARQCTVPLPPWLPKTSVSE